MSNMKNTAKKSLSKESPAVFWMPPPYSEIFEILSVPALRERMRAWLILLPQGFPANPSPSQEKEPDKPIQGICGHQQSSVFASYDRDLHSWKMSQGCLALDISDEFSETWPRAGTMQDGRVWEQTMSELTTEENESGYWPFKIGTPKHGTGTKGRSKKFREGKTPNPQEFVQKWPKPSTLDHKSDGQKVMDRIMNGKMKPCDQWLRNFVRKLPTPTRRDFRSGDKPEHRRAQNLTGKHTPMLNDVVAPGGQLNPTWIEWLMGWPEEWTDSKLLETDKFRSAWLEPFKSYLKELSKKEE